MKTKFMGVQWMALLLIACLFGSCAKSLQYWNQAITHFEKGAELEIKNHYAERMGAQGDIPEEALPKLNDIMAASATPASGGDGDPAGEYKMADDKVTQALAVPAPLEKEDKLGNALTLKALTSWKTGQMDEARSNAVAALEAFERSAEPSPRDQALAKAVPGLVALDMAYDSTNAFVGRLKALSDTAPDTAKEENEAVLAEGSRRYRKFVQDEDNQVSIAAARMQLRGARLFAGENEQLQLYLQLCELTGLKNRSDFLAQLDNFAKRSGLKSSDSDLATWLDEEDESYEEDRDTAMTRLKELLGGDTRHEVYRFWNVLL